MSRRNKRPRQLSPLELLRSLMGDSSRGTSADRSGFPGISSLVEPVRNKKPAPPLFARPHDEWLERFVSVERMFPLHLRARMLESKGTVEIKDVYSNGTIVGTLKTGSDSFFVFARNDGQETPAGCNCRTSNGLNACLHNYRFVICILEQLQNPSSNLSKRIDSGKLQSGSPDMTIFQFDNGKEVLSLLENLTMIAATESNHEELETTVSREPSRLAWNVCTENNSLRIDAILQPALKRGGYGKGKKTKLTALFQEDLNLSEADKRVRRAIKGHSDHYSTSYFLHTHEALTELIGESNVQLDGEPATVKHADVLVNLVKENSQYRFTTSNSNGDKCGLILVENSIVQIDSKNKTIGVAPCSQSQATVIRQLLKADPVSDVHEKPLVEQAKKLRHLVSLKMEESIAGRWIRETVKPVIVLRSRKDGALDYGIRVRDSQNRLFKPCQGILVHESTDNGNTVQLVRQVSQESELQSSVMKRLGLRNVSADGTVQGFEEALGLIDRLQAFEPGAPDKMSMADMTCHPLEVLWDKASEQPLKFLGTVSANNVRVGISQKRDWFNLTGECKLGDQTLDIAALLEGLRDASSADIRGEFVKVGDAGWARISDQLRTSLKQLDDSINQERGSLRFDKTSAHALRAIQQHIQVDSSRAWNECMLRLECSEKLEPSLPSGLKATMRDYQLEGFKWLRCLAEWGVGGILADDMGLGKTIQTLAVLLDRAADGPALVIAPTSVCFNWMREVEKFAPDLTASMYRETDRSDFLDSVGPNQVVVCSYGLALRDADRLAKVKWGSMVLDEAQAIKNSRSKTSIAINTIPAKWKVALTGTPVENHLGELWSLFHVVSPGVLGGWDQFRNRFASPIEKENDDDRRNALRTRLTPFILRRTKGQVLKDLPPRTEMNLVVELSPAERAIYDQVRMSALGEVDSIAKLPDIQDQRFRILALLTRLRQIACHPGLVHDTWTEGSAKLTQLSETLLQLKEEGHRVLIFSQFVKHLALIRDMLDQEKITYQYLDGSTPAAARQQQVDLFQNGDATAFLISLKAGGTGLNLTAADYVIHMDPWWNPAVEDQATDRAHRIGQDKPVMVYRIIAQNTIEEEILRLHDTKRDLVAGILDGTHSAAKLSTDDLIQLLRR